VSSREAVSVNTNFKSILVRLDEEIERKSTDYEADAHHSTACLIKVETFVFLSPYGNILLRSVGQVYQLLYVVEQRCFNLSHLITGSYSQNI